MSSKTIQIGEHKVPLPDLPQNPEEILFFHEKSPRWRRQEDLPAIFYDYNKYYTYIDQENTLYDEDEKLIALSTDDTKLLRKYQERELQRRTNGVWFKNIDQCIWMPGDYYFNLQWAPMLGLREKYGEFRWFQNDAMIIKWYADNDENILGVYFAKAKKTGISQIMAGALGNQCTMIRGKNFGVMSKTFDADAKALNMALFFYIIENLPDILLPEEKKRNEHEILWGRGKNWRQLKTTTKPLNTRVFASKTKPTGFDGPKMYWVWLDEFPKYWEAAKQSPKLVFTKTQETIKLQQTIVGKMYITSYSPEDDNRGFYEAKVIYYDSKLSTKDKVMGRTKSNLICHFIGTLESAEGCFLPNGKTDRIKALYLNTVERDLAKGDRTKLQAKMRQYPITEEEAWGVGGSSSVFDVIRLGIQKKQEDDLMRSGTRPYVEGKLLWRNSLWEMGKFDARPSGKFCEVYFEPLTDQQIMDGEEERLHIYEMPNENEVCRSLKNDNRDDNGRLKPMNDSINVGAVDPTDYADKSDITVGSKNASYTGNLHDPILNTKKGRVASNIILSEYFWRPENPDEFYEDMVKEIIFFDKRIIVEANKKWLVTALKHEGLQNYLLLKKADGTIAPWEAGDEDRLVSSTHDLIDAYIRAIKQYFAAVRGDVGIDYLLYYRSVRGLEQLMIFRSENRKFLDLVVALGLLRLAVESFSIFKNSKQEDEDDGGAMEVIFKRLLNN